MTRSLELRIACGMLASLALITSQVLLDPPITMVSFFDTIDDGRQGWLGWAMMSHGVLLFLSLILRCRTLAHWGLILGCLSWVALGMVLLYAWVTLKLVFVFMVIGLFCLVVFTISVQKKPRCNQSQPTY